jgi:chromate transporter
MWDLAALFLKLGTIAFGGPAAHTAMMRDEVVARRRWLTDREFLDLVAATNLIPGPNSTELAIHIGHRRAGWPGLLIAGACFILPATLIVFAIAWAYVQYGARPDVRGVFTGIAPVIIAIVIQALWNMAKTAVTSVGLALLGVASLVAVLAGVHELLVLGFAGLVAVVGTMARPSEARTAALAGLASLSAIRPRGLIASAVASTGAIASVSLGTLFWIFLKTGAVLFGSGYVLLAFLRADLVERLGWLTEAQLIDAIAVGQFTPGPVFTTATFIGYLLGGTSGAALATIGIFLPAFFFVAVTAPFIPRLRTSKVLSAALDGVTVASLALMASVIWQLGELALASWLHAAIAVVSLIVLVTTRVNSAWLILLGAIWGVVSHSLAFQP